ncbi:MAG TPA: UDP-glucose--hexose-1-phosphate uridylyltransferase [Clostridiales bacterium]|nr:UDP-glucose--hexose-1-phosphate uridylyltransferase [Clostridiales bacterium]
MNTAINQGAVLAEKLLRYALHNGLIEEDDIIWARNQLLDLLRIDEPLQDACIEDDPIPEYASPILEEILDYCHEKGILSENTLTHRDLLDTRIMGIFVSKPSDIISKFNRIKAADGITAATDYFYHLCQKSDYIRMERIKRNLKWNYDSPFGTLEITVNLTKPEKDPKEIAALKNAPQSGYPKCLLCIENVGYAGRINHPARQTHRTIPLELYGETWHFQYSPYVYYNEHCIVLKEEHVPMKLTRETYHRLFAFLDQFPHYFIGSNADLPIVGGSILNHDHFQGGRYVFPMEKASVEYPLECIEYENIEAAVVNWPMSVIRLASADKEALGDYAFHILSMWREYSDPEHDILAYSFDEAGNPIPHNTITPIARKKQDGRYELDLVLRNNRTSSEHPLGIFHPHQDLHHIKKENIGLIEVMGLFILPGRLQKELNAIKEYLTGNAAGSIYELDDPAHPLHHHSQWVKELVINYGTSLNETEAQSVLEEAVGKKCLRVLTDAGVFKTTDTGREGFDRFLAAVGLTRRQLSGYSPLLESLK